MQTDEKSNEKLKAIMEKVASEISTIAQRKPAYLDHNILRNWVKKLSATNG